MGDANKQKEQLDRQLAEEAVALDNRLKEENIRTEEQAKTTLDFTLDADCLHCLYKQPVSELTREQKVRLINEVATRTGQTIKNCLDCSEDLTRAQDILREHMANTAA